MENIGSPDNSREHPALAAYCIDPRRASPGNSARLLRDGEDAFLSLLKAINEAEKSVLLCVYSLADDATGMRFQSALRAAAARGVEVYLVYDAVGSIESARDFFEEMEHAGVHVAQYHPLVPWKPYWNWFGRNHRKLLVADDRAFICGFNMTGDYAPKSWGGRQWRDTGVEFSGPEVAQAREMFWESWRRCGMGMPSQKPAAQTAACGSLWLSVVSSAGLGRRNRIRRGYSYAIAKSQKYIFIENAYFLPGSFIYNGLIAAVARGVRVAIIIPSQSDHPYVRWASWAILGRLLKSGVEIYEWLPSVLHAKTAVIDGEWSTVGSQNLDHLSLHYNMELNVNVYGAEFGEQMRTMFEEDLKHCRRITLDEWNATPWLFKAASRVLFLFRNML
jgi:cardiolipin synthase